MDENLRGKPYKHEKKMKKESMKGE